MANPKHLALLKEGVAAWNESSYSLGGGLGADLQGARLDGENLVEADLERADLRGAHLRGASLARAKCSGANFTGARLDWARLSNASFSGARLCSADLAKASLIETDLYRANLSGANLSRATLNRARLIGANLSKAMLFRAYVYKANFTEADLTEADLRGTDLRGADLSRANLRGANLCGANLSWADLNEADFSAADLRGANLVAANTISTNFEGANLTSCRIYGVSAWDVKTDDKTSQRNLVITPEGAPEVSVDSLEVAQFIYLMLTNPKLRSVIDTIGRKAILILGRFTEERKAVLNAIRDALRQRGYVPILFDFDQPSSRDVTETVMTLAALSRFVIADLSDPKSLPQELSHIVPHMPSIPIQPILLSGQREYGMFEHFKRYPWVLPIHLYADVDSLLDEFEARVVRPAELRADELRQSK